MIKFHLSLWTFVGAILLVYGIIIFSAGIYYLYDPPVQTFLYNFNPSLWWGGILFILGLIFLGSQYQRRER